MTYQSSIQEEFHSSKGQKMASNEELRSAFDEVMFPNYNPTSIIPDHAKGATVYDVEGKEYIDLSGGIAVNALGHCHPQLVEVMKKQSERLWHISNIHTTQEAVTLAQVFKRKTFADRVFYCNSGAEANEAALKLARRYCYEKFGPEKNEIIAFNKSFHGRTLFTVSVGGQPKYQEGFGPIPQGITHVPFNDEEALEKAISSKTAAVIMEPIQGEGGIYPATKSFAKKVRELCDKHQAIMILDEIQTGVGRTGYLYAYEELEVIPDVLTTAKGIAGGFPFAAVLANDIVAKAFTPGTHGTTYGGNPMGCQIAKKVLEIVGEEKFLKEVLKKADYIKGRLNEINQKYPFFDELRGKGLLIGLGLKEEWKGKAKTFLKAGIDEGLIILVAGLDTVRLAPSLTITQEELDKGLERLEKAVKAALQS